MNQHPIAFSTTVYPTKRVLVFAPHPDDDVLGCAGTLAKHCAHHNDVTVVYVTSGQASPARYASQLTPQQLADTREQEAREALQMIGVQSIIFLRYEDGKVIPNKDIMTDFTRIIIEKKPHIIYTTQMYDGHLDHHHTGELVVAAIKATAVLDQSHWQVSQLFFFGIWRPLITITHMEDINDFAEIKLLAILSHRSHFKPTDLIYKRIASLEGERPTMTQEGTFLQNSYDYRFCECFYEVRLND